MTATSSTNTAATTWQIDPAHTQAEFEVKHMMFSKVRGRFAGLDGTISLGADGNVEASTVRATIKADTVDTGTKDRDAHLRSGDFFDVERFPELKFESRSVTAGKNGALTVVGDLTIRDVTRSVQLNVVETGRGIDPWGNSKIGFTATTSIDRRDFGLTWNQALEAGGILVGTDVRITLEIQASEIKG